MSLPCRTLCVAAATFTLLAASAARANSLPLWEAGLGAALLEFPDYRGADHSRVLLLPVPYFIYRGELLKADRDGLRGVLFGREDVEFNLSLSASPPVQSDDNAARSGMPDLKPSLELGGSLDYTLWRSSQGHYKLDLRTPLRAAFTVEARPRYIGLICNPRLNLDIRDPLGWEGGRFGIQAGPIFESQRNQAYFYSVDAAYATAQRPAYSAPGGYSGSQALLALSKRYGRTWLGAFARWTDLSGARYVDSPLVRQQDSFAAGIAVSWVLGQSSSMVEAAD